MPVPPDRNTTDQPDHAKQKGIKPTDNQINEGEHKMDNPRDIDFMTTDKIIK
jgi:hypothetical protein